MRTTSRAIILTAAALGLSSCAGATPPAPGTDQASPVASENERRKVAETVRPEVAKQCDELGLDVEIEDLIGGPATLVGNNEMSSPGNPACIYEPADSPSPNGLTSLALGFRANSEQSYRNSTGSMPGAVPVDLGTEGIWWESKTGDSYPTQHVLMILNGTTEIDVAGYYGKGTAPQPQRAKYEEIAQRLISK